MPSMPALGFNVLDSDTSKLAFFVSLGGFMRNTFLFYVSVFTVKMLRGIRNHLK